MASTASLNSVDAGDRNLARLAVAPQGFDRGEPHVVVGRPDAADLVAELGQPGVGLLQRLGSRPVGDLHVEQLHSGIGLERFHQAGLAFDRRHIGFDAAERDDAALAAHRLDQRFRHRLAIGNAAEGNMGDIVGVEIPGMQIVGLVPLGDDVGAGVLARLDDGTRVRAVVRIDVDDAIAAGLGENCLDVGDPLLAVAFRNQRHIVRADRLRECGAALVPGGVIGIGQRAN